MSKAARVLVVDDEEAARKSLERILRKEGCSVTPAASGEEAVEKLKRDEFHLVLADLVMEGGVGGMEVLDAVKERSRDTEVIIMTGYASVETAIAAMKRGAFHYLQKPFRTEEVRHLASQALDKVRLRTQVRKLEEEARARGEGPVIIGKSEKIQAILNLVRQIGPTDANVLITGESGTGKELVAAAIHGHSRRAGRRFLAINCGSFTEELLANELFGHEKDAYTGATSARPGLLESADGGTVFFDEVGDMPPAMQAKLLRVIQERVVFRVGGNKPVPVDIRVVAATNRDLKKALLQGLFREDLYYRLNVIPVFVPPLSERKEDIPLLAAHFLSGAARRMDRPLKGFTEEALRLLSDYNYPGNVRELENVVERAAALCRGDAVGVEDLPQDIRDVAVFRYDRETGGMKSLEEMEKDYIRWIMSRAENNKSKAAKILGIDRSSLYRKLKTYELIE
ncbi:MAG: sigma-54 dependent transcriptional regulator [bacterium]